MAIPKILDHERKLKNIQDGQEIFSITEGNLTTASGVASHAEGSDTTASGIAAHTEGQGTTASESCSHAEGYSATASGNSSHAEGYYTVASGNSSHAEGRGAIANSKSQHVQGEFNIIDTANKSTRGTYTHIVGNGSSDSTRSNAHTLDWDGNAWFEGDVYVGSTSGTNKDDGSKKLATEEYVDNSGGTFYAIHNTTTYQEIIDAFNAGKTCKALYSTETSYMYIFDLVTRPTSSNPTLYFVANVGGQNSSVTSTYTYIYINSASSWGVSNGTQNYVHTPIYSGGFQTPLSSSTAYYRPIRTSTVAPTASDGYVGDIWIQYSM